MVLIWRQLCRTVEEFSAGHVPGAINVPYMFRAGSGFVTLIKSHHYSLWNCLIINIICNLPCLYRHLLSTRIASTEKVSPKIWLISSACFICFCSEWVISFHNAKLSVLDGLGQSFQLCLLLVSKCAVSMLNLLNVLAIWRFQYLHSWLNHLWAFWLNFCHHEYQNPPKVW